MHRTPWEFTLTTCRLSKNQVNRGTNVLDFVAEFRTKILKKTKNHDSTHKNCLGVTKRIDGLHEA